MKDIPEAQINEIADKFYEDFINDPKNAEWVKKAKEQHLDIRKAIKMLHQAFVKEAVKDIEDPKP